MAWPGSARCGKAWQGKDLCCRRFVRALNVIEHALCDLIPVRECQFGNSTKSPKYLKDSVKELWFNAPGVAAMRPQYLKNTKFRK